MNTGGFFKPLKNSPRVSIFFRVDGCLISALKKSERLLNFLWNNFPA
jgi:hypothetical protein